MTPEYGLVSCTFMGGCTLCTVYAGSAFNLREKLDPCPTVKKKPDPDLHSTGQLPMHYDINSSFYMPGGSKRGSNCLDLTAPDNPNKTLHKVIGCR